MSGPQFDFVLHRLSIQVVQLQNRTPPKDAATEHHQKTKSSAWKFSYIKK